MPRVLAPLVLLLLWLMRIAASPHSLRIGEYKARCDLPLAAWTAPRRRARRRLCPCGFWAAGGRGRGSDGAGSLPELQPRACLLEMWSPSRKCDAVYGERTHLH